MSSFDFTAEMRATCRDMIDRLPELAHIDLGRVAVVYTRARNSSEYGIFASLTPLRFQNGESTTLRRGRRYTIQRVVDAAGVEMLYILTFCLPRFMNLPFDEKLVTVLHELWHISPEFNGDLRRHEGRCYAHTSSQKDYDAAMAVLAQRWTAASPPPARYEFLRHSWDEFLQRYPRVLGTRIKRPRLIPVGQPR